MALKVEIGDPYWTEVLPGNLWSRACALIRTIPPTRFGLAFDAPVLDWKECDDCHAVIADYWDVKGAEEMRAENKFGNLLCSRCLNKLIETAIERRKQRAIKDYLQRRLDGLLLPPARCNCGFLLVDCLVAHNPTCPGWDAPHPRHKGSPAGEGWTLWTLRLSLPTKKVAASKKQGSLFH